MASKLQELAKKLDYEFHDFKLLDTALRHRSTGKSSNERMEFLGDAVLNFIIASELYSLYPELREGELSRIRSNLVNEENLIELGTQFKLGNYLRLGIGESKSGGHKRPSIIADAMEAIIGAIFLDGGIESCRKAILTWQETKLKYLSLESLKDPKTKLQEYLQAKKLALPKYEVILTEGELHKQTFHVSCTISKLRLITEGIGPSKQKSEQDAAKKALDQIQNKMKK
jgi:ribonuclease-3